MAHEGKCEKPKPKETVECKCELQPHWAPVCGTDGFTYPNVELLECMKPCIQHGGNWYILTVLAEEQNSIK